MALRGTATSTPRQATSTLQGPCPSTPGPGGATPAGCLSPSPASSGAILTARPALARCTGAPPASAHRLASPACQPSPTFGGEGAPRIFLGTCLCRHARRRRRARHAAAIRPDRRRARPAPRPRRHLGGRRRHRRRADGAGPRRTWPRPRRPFPWRRHVGPGRARVRPAFPVTKGQNGMGGRGMCLCGKGLGLLPAAVSGG
mmetsp:Transcript_35301/g.104675  ORF Transcript_35301/g.104675 Transcript_35301/m.104675 type:complete len:201 (+) Transcript_35301:1109-1711(+)